MLIAIAFLVVGAAIGWVRAARRGGTLADRLQYAMAHGIPAFLVGVVLVVAGLNFGWF